MTVNGQSVALSYGYPAIRTRRQTASNATINGLGVLPADTGTRLRAGADPSPPPPVGFYYFGYGTVNGCFVTYEMATATTPPVVSIWADRYTSFAVGA